jgi:hypothetical protein
MHAVEMADPSNQHIARVADDEGPDAAYQCACLLAEMVGVRLGT